MKIPNHFPALLLGLLPGFAHAQGAAPTEAQCRGMTEGMLQTMKSTPLQNEKERRDAKALIEQVEKLVRENRAKGTSECATWAVVAKMMTTQ